MLPLFWTPRFEVVLTKVSNEQVGKPRKSKMEVFLGSAESNSCKLLLRETSGINIAVCFWQFQPSNRSSFANRCPSQRDLYAIWHTHSLTYPQTFSGLMLPFLLYKFPGLQRFGKPFSLVLLNDGNLSNCWCIDIQIDHTSPAPQFCASKWQISTRRRCLNMSLFFTICYSNTTAECYEPI